MAAAFVFPFCAAENELARRSLLGMPVVPSIFGEGLRPSGAIAAPNFCQCVPVARRTRAAVLLVRTFPPKLVSVGTTSGAFRNQFAAVRWFFPILVRPVVLHLGRCNHCSRAARPTPRHSPFALRDRIQGCRPRLVWLARLARAGKTSRL